MNCYHHGSARFVRMEKGNSMTMQNKGQYNDSGAWLGHRYYIKLIKQLYL